MAMMAITTSSSISVNACAAVVLIPWPCAFSKKEKKDDWGEFPRKSQNRKMRPRTTGGTVRVRREFWS